MDCLAQLFDELSYGQLTVSTAESCTGGGVAALITSVPGSSLYFKGGVVAYANEVKTGVLGVRPQTLEAHGAVSRETVGEMVAGVQRLMKTDCAVATSGIAGPGGGTPDKPVGTIWIAAAYKNEIYTRLLTQDHGRAQNVQNTIEKVLELLCEAIEHGKKSEKGEFF